MRGPAGRKAAVSNQDGQSAARGAPLPLTGMEGHRQSWRIRRLNPRQSKRSAMLIAGGRLRANPKFPRLRGWPVQFSIVRYDMPNEFCMSASTLTSGYQNKHTQRGWPLHAINSSTIGWLGGGWYKATILEESSDRPLKYRVMWTGYRGLKTWVPETDVTPKAVAAFLKHIKKLSAAEFAAHWEGVLILAAKKGDIYKVRSLPDLVRFANCMDQVRPSPYSYVCVLRACVRACVSVCVCVHVCMCICTHICAYMCIRGRGRDTQTHTSSE
jgi:hypothetical protein